MIFVVFIFFYFLLFESTEYLSSTDKMSSLLNDPNTSSPANVVRNIKSMSLESIRH